MTEETIFAEALEKKTPSDRTAYLDQACAGDVVLRQRMETLLKSHDVEDSFLGKPAIQCAAEELAGQPSAGDTKDELPRDGGDEALDFLVPSDKPGTLGRLGHYEVLEVIGRGGMGVVLRAFDEKLHRVVAIKVMAAQLAANGTARKRFTREAQAAAAVSHDHIVTIYAVEEASGHPYLVMQCISGMSLQERLDRNGPLQLAEIARIGMQTAAGLAAAHAQGLVHRDVKPANILLENGIERVKLTDFGLARAAADASFTQSGVIAGTPYFMSPEQARGDPVDQRTDLFSLGSVLYAMCTGRAPFRASGSMAVLKRVCEETPRPIRETNPEIPDWLVAIIDMLHAKDPAERFQTAKEVADLLGEHLADVQAGRTEGRKAAIETSATEAINRPLAGLGSPKTRRRGWVFAGAALVCVALLAGVAFYFNPFRTSHGTVVLRAEDVLPRLVGTWSIDVETTLPKQDPAKGVVRFDWIAGEKFLRSYTTYNQGSETLTVHRYSGDGTNFKRWFFSSQSAIQAIQSGTDGEWDMTTQTMTYRGTLPLWHKTAHVERWVDANHVEITTEIKDHLNEVILRQTKKMQRTQDMAVGPKAPADPKRPAEFALLDRQVGSWTNTLEVTLAELGGQKVQSRTTNETVPILAHRFVESNEKHEHGGGKEYWLLGYDELRRIFRVWHFGGDGEAMEADCAWDPKEKTLTWKSLDGRFNGAWTFTNDNERQASMSAKNAQGRPLFDVTGISRRDGAIAANDGGLPLFNGEDLTGWKTQPFIILPKEAKAEQKFATLAAAVDKAQSGDTVEIRGNGPFVSGPILIQGRSLTIRAGANFRPVFQLSSNITTDAPLVLEGLELQRLGDNVKVPASAEEALVCSRQESSSLYLANCRFREPLVVPCVFTRAQKYLVLNCEFLGLDMSSITTSYPPGKGRVIDNCPGYNTGKDGKGLGADVDLVGPGPAYERWKKTPEYQQWLKETGQKAVAAKVEDAAARRELAKWQGEWKNADYGRLVIRGERWSSHPKNGFEVVSTIKIVEVTDEMTHILLLNAGIDGKVRTIQTILRVDGDTLHNCGTIGSVRPTEFANKPGFIYTQWKRVTKTPP